MKLSRTKILLFFLAIGALGIFLYPREFFVAFMKEGAQNLAASEENYRIYLLSHPGDAYAVFRLADVYNRMGRPSEATQVLKDLLDKRPKDWKIAERYLAQLEEVGDLEKLYLARQAIAATFKNIKRFPKKRLTFLLESSLQYALYKQDFETAEGLLEELIKTVKDPRYFLALDESLDHGLKHIDKILTRLQLKLAKNPGNLDVRLDLINLLLVLKRIDEAKILAEATDRLTADNFTLMQTLYVIYGKLGDTLKEEKTIQRLLKLTNLDNEKKTALTRDLASLYQEMHRTNEALVLFKELLKQNPDEAQNWLSLIYAQSDLKLWDDAITTITLYLAKFPDDVEQSKNLVNLYLYEKKDASQLSLYKDFLNQHPDTAFALDVAYLLIENHQKTAALSWLQAIRRQFPHERKITVTLVGLLLEGGGNPQALPLLRELLRTEPDNTEWILALVNLETRFGSKNAVLNLLERLATLKSDASTLSLVGRELLFLGFGTRAEHHLLMSLDKNPTSDETWFWLAETAYYLGNTSDGKARSAKVVELIEKRGSTPSSSPLQRGRETPLEQTRMLLKSKARIKIDEAILSLYTAALKTYPASKDLRLDFIDTLLEHGAIKRSAEQITLYLKRYPFDREALLPYKVRLAFLKHEWLQASKMLKRLVAKNPLAWAFRRDLGEALVLSGNWLEGIREYDKVALATTNELSIKRRLNELHDTFDNKIGTGIHYVSLGSESYWEESLFGEIFFGEPLRLLTTVKTGQYDSPSNAFTGTVLSGDMTLRYQPKPAWRFEAGITFGTDDLRETFGGRFGIRFEPEENSHIELTGSVRELRLDMPQSVANGQIDDRFSLNAETLLKKRLILKGEATFERHILPSGETGYGYRLQPSLAYITFFEPFVTFGYQFTFSDEAGAAFLARVPLISRSQTHYLTAYLAQYITDNLKFEASLFAGEDTARSLHLFEGDLFGTALRLKWFASRHIIFDAGYDFGKETRSGISGKAHQIGLTLTGHWF